MTKKVNTKTQVKAVKTQKANTINNMQDIFDYVNAIAKTNKNVKLQKVTGYVALKYANKTICELHDKKRSIAHITISNKNNAFAILKQADAITRVVADSYGWRLNTECLLQANCLAVITKVIDSLIAETQAQFEAKTQKQQKQQQKTA